MNLGKGIKTSTDKIIDTGAIFKGEGPNGR